MCHLPPQIDCRCHVEQLLDLGLGEQRLGPGCLAAEGPQRARDECSAGFGYRLAGYLLAGFGRLCQPVEAKQIRGGSGHATIAPQASATGWQASATGLQAYVASVSRLRLKELRGSSRQATIIPQASATDWQASATGWQASVDPVSQMKPAGTIAQQASATCWQASATRWQASVASVSEFRPSI